MAVAQDKAGGMAAKRSIRATTTMRVWSHTVRARQDWAEGGGVGEGIDHDSDRRKKADRPERPTSSAPNAGARGMESARKLFADKGIARIDGRPPAKAESASREPWERTVRMIKARCDHQRPEGAQREGIGPPASFGSDCLDDTPGDGRMAWNGGVAIAHFDAVAPR